MKKLPKLEDYFLYQSLYVEYIYDFERVLDSENDQLPVKKSEVLNFVKDLGNLSAKINGFCKQCNEIRTFISENTIHHTESWRKSNAKLFIPEGLIVNEFKCAFDEMHRVYFVTKLNSNSFLKIGQYYSLTDFQNSDYNKFRSIIDNEKIKELNKAVGLYSHEIGIGSFTYLRRIIDYLIDKAHKRAKSSKGWNETKYNESRIPEKIKLLESELPEFLVSNRELYSILSKGIHELSEEECLDYFPLLKSGIDNILDDELERKNKAKKMKIDSVEISKLYAKYKNKSRKS